MDLFPAIDLREGRCVRLLRGDFESETRYGDPLEIARSFEDQGARWLHVVDLDAARTGVGANREIVLRLAASVTMQVQAGGGIRDAEVARALLGGGVERVVLGTAALAEPAFVAALAAELPGRVAVGLDHRRDGTGRREVVVSGWEVGSGVSLEEALARLSDVPLGAVVVTDVGTDGTLAGPDLEGLRDVLAESEVPVVASGGVGSLADLRALAALEGAGRRLAGVIVGRAILSGAFTVAEGVAACAQ